MDKYYIPVECNLASSLIVTCQILGYDFEKTLNAGLESLLDGLSNEIKNNKDRAELQP
jgi:hypothetical protein